MVAFGRNQDKLGVAREYGADHVININGKAIDDIRAELKKATGHKEIDAAVDCVGAQETIQMGFNLLATAGTYCSVGLVGTRIDIPLFPFVAREFTYHGSFWGNYNDLSEVIALAQQGKIRHTMKQVRFDDINEALPESVENQEEFDNVISILQNLQLVILEPDQVEDYKQRRLDEKAESDDGKPADPPAPEKSGPEQRGKRRQ